MNEGLKAKFQSVCLKDRIRGSLIGGAAGDALGYAVEFMPLEDICQTYGEQGIQSYDLDPYSGEALISDDTQMTMFTADGLIRGAIAADYSSREPAVRYIYDAYMDWLRTQEMDCCSGGNETTDHRSWLLNEEKLHNRRAPGGTCLSALRSGRMGTIDEPLNDRRGCGGVMRVAPVGLFRKNRNSADVMLEAAQAAAITHGEPMGYIPAGVLAFIIHRIVYCGEIDLYRIVRDAQDMIPMVFGENAMSERMMNYLGLAMLISQNESEEDWPNIGRLGEGWAGDEALAIAVYCCLRYYHNFSKCLEAAVNHDGDSDSTGAIAGNILGALYGYEALDAKWKENLELGSVILELADDMYEYIEGAMSEKQILKYKEGNEE